MSKIKPYNLYQSLDVKVPETDLKKTQKKKFTELTADLTENQKISFLKLIIEHARLNDKYNENSEIFPYTELSKNETTQLIFDVNEFPLKLRWILFRFLEVCNKEEKW